MQIFAGDSTKIVANVERQIETGPPFAPNTFDKILLDAACSGTGLRPMLSNRIMSEAKTLSFSKLQKSFVDNVSHSFIISFHHNIMCVIGRAFHTVVIP